MSWKNLSDYWDDYEYKNIIESIWNNYEENQKEKLYLLSQINDSKSIITAPYSFKKKWKKLKWKKEGEIFKLLTNFINETIVNIPIKLEDGSYNLRTKENKPFIIKDENGNELNYSLEIDVPQNNIQISGIDPIFLEKYITNNSLEVWVKEYYIHNEYILKTYAPLVELDETIYGINKYSKMYFNIIKAMWFVSVTGPTILNIKIGLYLIYNLPITLQENSKLEIFNKNHIKLDTGEEWNLDGKLELAKKYPKENPYWKIGEFEIDENIEEMYYIDNSEKGNIEEQEEKEKYDIIKKEEKEIIRSTKLEEGMTVPQFTFLVDGPQLIDYLNNPKWLKEQYYFKDAIEIEKYCSTYVEIPSEREEKNLDIIVKFLNKIVPQYIKFNIILRDQLLDTFNAQDELIIRSKTYLIEEKPKIDGKFKFDGNIKYDNFGDDLTISIYEYKNGEKTKIDDYIRVY
ncbi:MAG: hypothetical protein ACOCRX_04935 [Candidatus Woesearchaeota archaeon]